MGDFAQKSTQTRKALYMAVSALIDKAAENYAKSSGRQMDAKYIRFIKEMVMSMIDLLDEAYKNDGKISPSDIGKLAFSRAIHIAGLSAEEKSSLECGAAVAALALATVDVFAILTAAAGMTVTGAGSIIGIPVMLASATFYAYQVNDVAVACGEAYVTAVEKRYEAQNIRPKKAMVTTYSNSFCTSI